MHLRAVAGLPCPPPALRVDRALMVNVLGRVDGCAAAGMVKRAMGVGAGVHWYGKTESREGRKMGHITLTGRSEAELVRKADALGIDR
jgi:phosphoribosylaminoimidazole carboxylase (NCAIR synthetase)